MSEGNNVVELDILTTVDEPVDQVLEKAKKWGMAECVIVGYDDGGTLIFGGNKSDAATILLLLERAKKWLMDQAQ